jgi:lysine-ketoglutarate reductase/saccharopine dehydrogenase-like protein (TIGR00300 family)
MSVQVASEIVEAEGHLIDSQLLTLIFDKVIERGARFEVLHFDIGRTNEDFSRLRLKVTASDPAGLQGLLQELMPLGCHPVGEQDAETRAADLDGCAPPDFYSTTNQHTSVRHRSRWIDVEHQRMDAAIVIEQSRAVCRKLRNLRQGDAVVCGVNGVRVTPEFRERDRLGFAFMTNDISSERRVEVSVARIAAMMRDVRQEGGRIALVAGPVVVHTGGVEHFCQLIRLGFVQVLLAGNALAVHDVEFAFFGTSLGVDLAHGRPVQGGHQHHMRAINTIVRAGGVEKAVESGVLRTGIMHDCVRHRVEYVLAGSIRDDGPLPETVMDLIAAQDRYAAALDGVDLVLVLSSMLHGIGVGNMLPARVKVVCVDINPAVVTKLADRGSSQTLGLVTDVGLFLHHLAQTLAAG